MTRTVFTGARLLDADLAGITPGSSTIVVEDGRIARIVADDTAVEGAVVAGDDVVELAGQVVVPGFVDSHVHLVWMGQSLASVALTDAPDLATIQRRLRAERERIGPDATVLRGKGWLFDALDTEPTAAMIDEVVADIPVFLDSNDMHSVWVNTAALRTMGVDAETPDPPSGRLSRLPSGEPAGMLYERAAHEIGWAHLAATTTDRDRVDAVRRALEAFAAAGVTSVVDMGMDEDGWEALHTLAHESGGRLPVRVVAHWLIPDSGDSTSNRASVDRAAELSARGSTWMRVIGVKLVLDGVIDSCTAALRHPYANGSNAELMWDEGRLREVVLAADAARLRLAIHAIGDRASDVALDVIEAVVAANAPWDRRPRLEHLEIVSDDTPARMAALAVTASIQPVHADPAIQPNWRAQLGDERVERGYPWPVFGAAGARVALGTDAPTAPHEALVNLHIATTRESVIDSALPANTPGSVLPIDQALRHATIDSAASFAADGDLGRIAPGYAADFVVLTDDPTSRGTLLGTAVVLTVVDGEVVHRNGAAS
jgi:predicted amidohydrolase YtcJ